MNDRTTISPGDALNAATGDLFKQAASEGRDALNADELQRFVASFGAALAEGVPGGVDLRIALENTREFGVLLTAGQGGLDGALDRANFRKDRAAVSASVELTDAADFLRLFRRTVAYQKMAALAHGDGRRAPDPVLEFCFGLMLGLGREFSVQNPEALFVIQRIELDQVQFAKKPTVGSARVEFGKPVAGRLPRPVHKIDKLIHPQSIGIVGVSASGMNFGRIILKNLMGSGYAKEKLTIIRPGETEIDGVSCVESLRVLPAKLDLLIVAVPNDAVYELVDEIIATDAVESVMLIPGGLGETAKSREPAAALAKINAAHANPGGGPVFLGANCLGVVSHPGGYDSWFIPLERLPKPQKKAHANSVMLSQSGAFMITRISQNPWLDPAYMLALGNQTDLTHGDMLGFFAEREGIDTLGIYIEGFKDGDGLDFARAVRKAVLNGKQVVVYKSGRTEAGAGGVMGHTASIAGDPVLFEAVLGQAGAIVAEDFNTFDDLFYIAGALHGKKVGKRLGAISGAGFEAVGMADSIVTETGSLEMGALEAATVERVQTILAANGLDALVEVRNPIDINPGRDDGVHLQITEAFLDDPNIDAVVVGLDPTAPSIRGLETSKLRPGYDLSDPNGTVHIYPPLAAKSDKPVIGIVDGGSLYDAMAAKLMDQGVCVFRNCGRGTRALARYVEARVEADAIRAREN
uniref:CoA-binding domain-containing protein n=1 Tax=Aromatoleum evansii TaxID=59406 RepID=Q8KKF2_AROEV|nr:hypothetical protein [Aromatoleum evansii]